MRGEAPVTTPVATTCPYCGVGCGVVATPDGRGGAAIAGDERHPANRGRLCSKGSALGETLGLDGRLLHPWVEGSRASWDVALDRVAEGIRETIARHGPGAVAFYLSGQMLTEDYYVANKLAKGFIGTPHVDTNSRLCMASSVAGHRRAFGSDTVPGSYEDLDRADLLVLVGSNAAWCHPVLFRRMVAAREARAARLVVIDPRRTATADEADLFLAIRPGTDAALFCGLLVHLRDHGGIDESYVADHTSGFEAALARARAIAPDVAATARATGLAEADVARFFALFAETTRAVTLYSQGVNQSARGTDKVNAILNVHLATGRIGREGMGPFSLTGQPNAMGGREVGGLANMLAAHMGFSAPEVDRVRRFWNAPAIVASEGLKAVAMMEAIERGEIRALWVIATNPVVSLPDADRVRRALRSLDLFVVSDVVPDTDTIAAGPHVLLPAAAWGEKEGTVTNSERRISRQRAFLSPPGEARADWWALAQVARRLGHGAAFAYDGPAAIFREHAALSAFENEGTRDFDIGALRDLSDADYEALAPVQWPCRRGEAPRERLFAQGGFFTPDRRARLIAIEPPAPAAATGGAYPFRLNTGRVRDHWHTLTRTGRSPRLSAHVDAPFLALHPADAARLGLSDGDLAEVSAPTGTVILEVRVTDGQAEGEIFAPIHWSDATASAARIGALASSAVDPFSGQPDLKATPASVRPVAMATRGFLLARSPEKLDGAPADWWSRVAVEGGTGFRLATRAEPAAFAEWAARAFHEAALIEYADSAAGIYRCAALDGHRLEAVLFLGPSRPCWSAAKAAFAAPALDAQSRAALLSGRAPDGAGGAVVCACFGVALPLIQTAIRTGRAETPEAIGTLLRAGTNCGSCLPDLKRIIAHERAPAAG